MFSETKWTFTDRLLIAMSCTTSTQIWKIYHSIPMQPRRYSRFIILNSIITITLEDAISIRQIQTFSRAFLDTRHRRYYWAFEFLKKARQVCLLNLIDLRYYSIRFIIQSIQLNWKIIFTIFCVHTHLLETVSISGSWSHDYNY